MRSNIALLGMSKVVSMATKTKKFSTAKDKLKSLETLILTIQ